MKIYSILDSDTYTIRNVGHITSLYLLFHDRGKSSTYVYFSSSVLSGRSQLSILKVMKRLLGDTKFVLYHIDSLARITTGCSLNVLGTNIFGMASSTVNPKHTFAKNPILYTSVSHVTETEVNLAISLRNHILLLKGIGLDCFALENSACEMCSDIFSF